MPFFADDNVVSNNTENSTGENAWFHQHNNFHVIFDDLKGFAYPIFFAVIIKNNQQSNNLRTYKLTEEIKNSKPTWINREGQSIYYHGMCQVCQVEQF